MHNLRLCKTTNPKVHSASAVEIFKESGMPIQIRPVAVYGSECWVLTENIKQKLLVFERKILRRIFGPTQRANGEWRLTTNDELEKAINNENIVKYIKYKRLS